MRAGQMVHPLTVQRWTEAGVDALGTPTGAWADLVRLRAELVELKDGAGNGERGATQEAGITARVRAVVPIVPGDRVQFRGVDYRVALVTAIGRRGLELVAVADVPGA